MLIGIVWNVNPWRLLRFIRAFSFKNLLQECMIIVIELPEQRWFHVGHKHNVDNRKDFVFFYWRKMKCQKYIRYSFVTRKETILMKRNESLDRH